MTDWATSSTCMLDTRVGLDRTRTRRPRRMEGEAFSWDVGRWWEIWTARRKRTDSVRARERELGMLNKLISWFAHLIISAVDKSNGSPGRRVGSHRTLRGPHRRGGVSGALLSCLFFSACCPPPVLWHVPRTPLDRTHSSILPRLSPFSHFFCLCRITC